MQAVRSKEVDAIKLTSHRGGGLSVQRLLQGKPGSPDNFELSLLRVEAGYHTPRHHHNFDQLPMVLEGRHQYAPKKYMPEGSVTYFPEGAYYGPQTGEGALLLELQFGGATGNGFMSYDELAAGNKTLAERGTFEKGIYRWTDATGKPRNKDGYEAIWEDVSGRPVVYPQPRFEHPIMMIPENFAWVPSTEPGMEEKHLASFTERRISVGFLRYAPGATHRIADSQGTELHFILRGALQAGDGLYGSWTAFKIESGEVAALEAVEETETYVVRLPSFAQ